MKIIILLMVTSAFAQVDNSVEFNKAKSLFNSGSKVEKVLKSDYNCRLIAPYSYEGQKQSMKFAMKHRSLVEISSSTASVNVKISEIKKKNEEIYVFLKKSGTYLICQ